MKANGLKSAAALLVVVGSLVYTIVAMISDWEPALSLIRMQALWNGGTYYVKLTFLTTWLVLLTPPLLAVGLIAAVQGLLSAQQTPPSDAENPLAWAVLHQRSPRAVLAPSLVAAVLGGGFLLEAMLSPETFLPIGMGASLLLMVAPLALLLGAGVALDALVPARWHWGTIDNLIVQPGQRNAPPQYMIHSAGKSWNVPETLFSRLRIGQQIGVLHGAVLNRFHQLRAHTLPLR